jgi:hypothetical protein
MRNAIVVLMGALGAAGCASEAQYTFRPAEQATALVGGQPAARYAIPPESPRGTLRVATCGVAGVDTTSGTVHTLHVRLVVANNNDTGPWEVDADALRAVYASGDVLAPIFINTSTPDAPEVRIAPGESATIDAYFPLADGVQGPEGVPRFDLLSKVRTPEREVVERTPFERIRIEPVVAANTSYTLGMWPVWWYDPLLVTSPMGLTRPRVYVAPHR